MKAFQIDLKACLGLPHRRLEKLRLVFTSWAKPTSWSSLLRIAIVVHDSKKFWNVHCIRIVWWTQFVAPKMPLQNAKFPLIGQLYHCCSLLTEQDMCTIYESCNSSFRSCLILIYCILTWWWFAVFICFSTTYSMSKCHHYGLFISWRGSCQQQCHISLFSFLHCVTLGTAGVGFQLIWFYSLCWCSFIKYTAFCT